MQHVRALVDDQSELESSAQSDGTQSSESRTFLRPLTASIGSGASAGLVFGVSDIVRASSASDGWIGLQCCAAVLGIWLWFGAILGVVFFGARLVGAAVKRRMPNAIAWHGLLTVIAGGIALLLARKVFAGGGIRRTYIGSLGPWVVPLGVMLSASAAPWIAARIAVDGSSRATRWTVSLVAATLSILTLILDAHAPGGMLYFHVLLLALGIALAFQAVELVRVPPTANYVAIAISLLTLPSVLGLPASRSVRELSAQPTWAGMQLLDYAQFHLDGDRDGYSPLFGGGDCDDANPSVYYGAPERAGDGRDSDCDGLDDPRYSGLPFAPFNTNGEAAQRIAEQAKRFPTVVILVDALRFDRVGSPRFPNLALLTRESIQFTRLYSTSATTLSSVPAMMTGRVRPGAGADNIAQALSHVGRSTRLIAPDVIREHFHKLDQRDPLLSFSSRQTIPTDHRTGWGAGDTVPTRDQITEGAVRSLDSAEPPTLLWLHYFDLHQWNVLEETNLPAFGDVARYDAVLERLDARLRPLIEKRDRLNIVLIADHGEALGTRGLRHHGSFVFHDLAHIPFLLHVPGIDAATVAAPVTSTGVFNTLRQLCGLEPLADADPSLLGLVGVANPGDGPGFASFDNAQWSLIHGHYRLLYMPHHQLIELYDLDRDPFEKINRADEDSKRAAELLARLFQLRNSEAHNR